MTKTMNKYLEKIAGVSIASVEGLAHLAGKKLNPASNMAAAASIIKRNKVFAEATGRSNVARGPVPSLKDLHEDMGAPKGGFKTRSEAFDHVANKRLNIMFSKDHSSGDFQKVQQAWDHYQKHPQGLRSLPEGHMSKAAELKLVYWEKIASFDFSKIKPILNSREASLGIKMGVASGAAKAVSTASDNKRLKTMLLNGDISEESYHRYKKNTLGQAALGAGKGAAFGAALGHWAKPITINA